MKFKKLGRYRTGGTDDHMQLGVPPPRTPDGRVYRFSPNENAHPCHFVIGPVAAEVPLTDGLRARMKLEPRSRQCVCPYTGAVGTDDDFLHPEDRDAAIEVVKHAAMQDVEDAIVGMLTSAFGGRTSRKGPISISMKLARGAPPPAPRFARRDLMRELVCDHCGRDYGVFAIGLFCPDCGAPNLRLHFAREAELVGNQASMAEALTDSKEELAYRLLGNAHEDVLTAFEATLKTVYLYGKVQAGIETRPKVGNDFQNVEKSGRRFAELGLDPFDSLGSGPINLRAG
ncbi:hypothetical protein [Ancylobacter sp. G4_0304]|uniref:hypothetical protein n=1 Tax=Ancylobacter sp. G4_0304 TaxID=3114289 RepID=UPI0039C650AB